MFLRGGPARNALWPQFEQAAISLRQQGYTNGEIARELGISTQNIWHWIGPTPKRLGGTRPHNMGLRDRAFYLRECGYTIRETAEIMKLPRSTVGDWVRGMPCD